MSSPPRVFIVILNWNGWKDTIECLESLKNLDYPDYEVVVVDNGSTDDSVERLRDPGGTVPPRGDSPPRRILIRNSENLGFSGGNNVGIKYALEHGADYVLILNNDTTVEKDFLKELIAVGGSDQRIGAVGAKILFYDNHSLIWHAGGGKFSWFAGSTPKDYKKVDGEALRQAQGEELDFITGACMLVKREVIEKVGMLDERFFLYYEDVEWSLKIGKAGYTLVYAPRARVYHKIHASAESLPDPVVWYYHIRNVLLTARLHAPPYLRLLIYVWACWRWYLKQYMKQIIWPAKREEAQLIRQGLLDFWKGKFGPLKA